MSVRRDAREAEKRLRGEPPPVVEVTNPGRLTYPRDGITKRQVVDYHLRVAPAFLRAVQDRPLQFSHWPHDIDHAPWFQQNIGDEAEPWMRLETVTTRTSRRPVRHLVADSPRALAWLAQHNALEIHCFSSRAESLETPDWVVFDLDPAPGRPLSDAVEVALVLKELLDRLGLGCVPKTSGKRGLHLYLGLAPGHTHEEAVRFASRIGAAVAGRLPQVTMERSLARRRGRLYLDCFQNGRGKTLIAPYSLRAIDGAPVSTPLRWKEVTPRLLAAAFNLRTVPKRLDRLGDPFEAVFTHRATLPALH